MHARVAMDPRVCHGKPIIRGTRVSVARILGSLAGGDRIEDVERDYGISREDILAALDYAAELIESEQHLPLPV